MSFKFIELGLVALKKLFNGLDELDVPLLEVLRYQVRSMTGFWPVIEKTRSDPDTGLCHTKMMSS